MRILQLEDDPFIAELTQLELARQQIQCVWTTADSGAAYSLALEYPDFDLIISDFTVPGMDGRNALRLAKKKLPNVPFVFVSGTADERIVAECLAAGATDFVSKDQLWKLVSVVRSMSAGNDKH